MAQLVASGFSAGNGYSPVQLLERQPAAARERDGLPLLLLGLVLVPLYYLVISLLKVWNRIR